MQEEDARYAAKDCGDFDGGHAHQHSRLGEPRAEQQRAEREAFGNFVNANGHYQWKSKGASATTTTSASNTSSSSSASEFFLVAGSDGQSVSNTMNAERDHHTGSDFAKAMGGGFIEMAGGTRRTDVENVFGHEEEKEVAGRQGEQQGPQV